MKNLFKTLIITMALLAASTQTAFSGTNSGIADKNFGRDGGGTNLNDQPVSVEDIENNVKMYSNNKGKLQNLFFSLDSHFPFNKYYDGNEMVDISIVNVDEEGVSATTKIPKIKWVFKRNIGCEHKDSKGVKSMKDASIIDKENLIVCLSSGRLSKKLTSLSLEKGLIEVMAHEVAHLQVGRGEKIPDYISSLIKRKYISIGSSTVRDVNFNLISNIDSVGASLNAITKIMNSTSDYSTELGSIAVLVGQIVSTVWSINNNAIAINNNLQSILSNKELNSLLYPGFQSTLLLFSVLSDRAIAEFAPNFDVNIREASLSELNKQFDLVGFDIDVDGLENIHPAAAFAKKQKYLVPHKGDVEVFKQTVSNLQVFFDKLLKDIESRL